MFFLNKNKILEDMIDEYFAVCDESQDSCNNAISYYFENGCNSEFEVKLAKCVKLESNADSKLHSIENFLYKKSLLPDAREDILNLFEKFDDIVDTTTHILEFMYGRNVSIPNDSKSNFKEITKLSTETYPMVKDAIKALIYRDDKAIKHLVRSINDNESVCDTIEMKTIKKIFDSKDIADFDKMVLSQLIEMFGNITNSCEDVADIIVISNIKRVL